MKPVVIALIVAASLATATAAQAPQSTARIRGRVIAAATGRPLMRATVTLRGGAAAVQRIVRTDANGQYEIADLSAGRYSFFVSRAGYLDQNFDQAHPLARYRLLELAEGEQLDGVNFSLQRGAVITGVITDEAGDPLSDVQVVAMREQYGSTGRRFVREARNIGDIRTDDEGRYRVYGLRPGTYVVTATTHVMWSDLDFGRAYYPGTLDESEARTVRVDIGLDAVADFSMIPAKRARVSGIVRDSQGRPAAGWRWMLQERRGPAVEPIGGGELKDDGSFEIERMLSGQYILEVRPPYVRGRPAPPNAEFATVPVTVRDEDISGLAITTSAGYVLTGRVIVEGATAAPVVKGLSVTALPMEPSVQQVFAPPSPENRLVDVANRFRVVGVRGKVRMAGGGGGWFTKRVLLRGQDVTKSGFEVTGDIDGIEVVLTNQATTVTGAARDSRGIGRNDFIVAFFPVGDFETFEKPARQRTIRPDPDGVYRIRNLPPGDYLAAAVPAMSLPLEGEWDPAFFDRVRPRATGFTLAEGQTFTLNLTLIE